MAMSQAVADETGRFRFSKIAAGSYELTARHEIGRTPRAVEIVAEPGVEASGVELRLGSTVRVTGRLDRSVFGGHQPRDAWLTLVTEDGSGGGAPAQVGGDGSFTLQEVLPGTYRVTVWASFPDGKGREYEGEGTLVVGARDLSGVQIRVRPKPEAPPQKEHKK